MKAAKEHVQVRFHPSARVEAMPTIFSASPAGSEPALRSVGQSRIGPVNFPRIVLAPVNGPLRLSNAQIGTRARKIATTNGATRVYNRSDAWNQRADQRQVRRDDFQKNRDQRWENLESRREDRQNFRDQRREDWQQHREDLWDYRADRAEEIWDNARDFYDDVFDDVWWG